MAARKTGATPGAPAPFSVARRAARSATLARERLLHLAFGPRRHTLPRDSDKAVLAGDSSALQCGRVFPPPPTFAPPPRRRHLHKKCRKDWMAHDRALTADEGAPFARHPPART